MEVGYRMKALGRVIASVIVLVLTGLVAAFARYTPDLVFGFYTDFSRRVAAALGRIFGNLPFSVCEIAIYLILLWIVYTFIRVIARRKGLLAWAAGILLFASCALLAFTVLWGANHFGPEITDQLGIPVREYTRDELEAAAQYYLEEANALAPQMKRQDADQPAEFSDFAVLARAAVDSYTTLAAQYPYYTTPAALPKRILGWYPMSKAGLTGIYLCFTGESCVNPDTYTVALPFVMCHELAHAQAIASESGANFSAFLACSGSDNLQLRYAAYYSAFIYCYNAVSRVDQVAAADLWNAMDPGLKADVLANNARSAKYAGKTHDTVEKINDVYLKAFSETQGVQSYGAVADDLVAWYLIQSAPAG